MSKYNHSLDELRTWIGREDKSEEILTPALAERFHRTLDLPGDPPREGEGAPRLIHFALCQPAVATSILDVDGHIARGNFLPPVPLPRRMWAAGDLNFYDDLIVGQKIGRTSRIADVTFKMGGSGPLYFVVIDHRIETNGLLNIEERQTIVYRQIQMKEERLAQNRIDIPNCEQIRSIAAPPTLLFRYSALTFNTHRIHYDRSYALQEEGYPGLVVHGPLQATWLLHYAAQTACDTPPRRFCFRGLSALFDHDVITLVAGHRTDSGQDFWTCRRNGTAAMQARAEW